MKAAARGFIQLWLANTHIVLYTNFVVLTWQYIGFGIVLLLAGLPGGPAELREAAAIDGATPWQATRRVTLPLLGPTIRIWIFLTVIGSLQVFDVVWILTGGGPGIGGLHRVSTQARLARHGGGRDRPGGAGLRIR